MAAKPRVSALMLCKTALAASDGRITVSQTAFADALAIKATASPYIVP
jgi:hypothetical protein